MCGRYTQHHSTDQVVMRFDVSMVVQETRERYNIAPTQMAPVIIQQDEARILEAFKWGLIPFWAKDAAIGSKMLNARAETLAEKPAFRAALKKRRCLVPADGYYEWSRAGNAKIPHYYELNGGELFALAGLWEEWRQPDGSTLRSYTIITTEPNDLARETHDRMPAILLPEDEAEWLDPHITGAETVLPLLRPFPNNGMSEYEVSTRVNTPAFDDALLIDRSPLHQTQ